MKKHIAHLTLGGVLAPTTLGLAAAIANESQTLIGLHLQGVALALYIAPFLVGCAAIVHGLVKLQAGQVLGDLAGIFGEVLGGQPAAKAAGPLALTHPSPSEVIQEPGNVPPPPPPPAP